MDFDLYYFMITLLIGFFIIYLIYPKPNIIFKNYNNGKKCFNSQKKEVECPI